MALLLGTLSTVSPLSIDTFFPSIPAIAADFHLSAWQVQQIITSYMLPYAVFTLVHGPLSDALGRRNLVVLGMLLYTAASAGCAFAPSFGALLVCRVLQGIAAGIGPTIARAVVRDLYDGHNAQRLMSIMMMVFSVAPAIGPVIGGWLHVAFGWRSVFGFMVFMGLCLALFAYLSLPETHPPEKRSEFHLGQLARVSGGIMASADFMLFGPVVSGFMSSSFIASRLAGVVSRPAMLRFGFLLMTTATALMLLLQSTVSPLPLWPQQVLLFCMAFGAQFTFPILSLEMLDLQPNARGAASSVSTFVALGFGAVVMGVIAPALGGVLWRIELAATLAGLTAFVLWRIARARVAAQAAHVH